MLTTTALLDAVKSANSIPSDYRLARTINVTDNTLYLWRHGKTPDEDNAAKLAKMAGFDVGFVLVCIAAERSKSPEARAALLEAARILRIAKPAQVSDKMPPPSGGGGSFKTSMDKGSAPDSASRRVDLSSYTSSPVSDGAALALACLSGIISRRERLKCPPVSHLETV